MFECIANTENTRRNRLEFTSVRQDESDQDEIKKIDEKMREKSNQTKYLKNSVHTSTNQMVKQPTAPIDTIIGQSTRKFPEPILKPATTKPDPIIVKRNKPKTELEIKIIETQGEHPSKKKDIFKAIFDSDSETENSEEDEQNNKSSNVSKTINADVMASLTKPSTSLYAQLPDEAFKPKSAREMNILRNTSPPRGIFSGLTLKRTEPVAKTNYPEMESSVKGPDGISDDMSHSYGPCLPPVKLSSSTNEPSKCSTAATSSISLSKTKVIYEEKWIEKSDEKEKKTKKEKKQRKDRGKHKRKKQKKEKHKKKKR